MDCAIAYPILFVIARILTGTLFLYAGIFNLFHWSNLNNVLVQKKLPFSGLLLTIAIVFEIIAALMIIIGMWVKLFAILLIAFTLVATLLFHDFWNKPAGESRWLNRSVFLTHITTTLAALLFLIAI